MNEWIKELERQADEYADGLGLAGDEWCDAQTTRFAELIVQSILNTLETEREFYANPGTYQFLEYYTKMSAKREALNDAISLIRSNFGVK